MSLDILVVLLITLMTIIQFDLKSAKGRVALGIGLIAFIFQSFSIYQTKKENEIQKAQISEIKASVEAPIDWKKSKVQLEFVEDKVSKPFFDNLQIVLKIYPLNEKILSSDKININEIIKTAQENKLTGYKELTTEQALNLFNMFSENGKINNTIEEQAGINHLYLMSEHIDKEDKKIINLKSEYSGATALKNFDTLKKLNNSILVAYLPVLDHHNDATINVVNKLTLKLESSYGERRLTFYAKPIQWPNIKEYDIIGIYIPRDYF